MAGDLKITQSGEGGVAQAIAAQLGMVEQRALIALAIEANVIMLDAQRRAPMDTGELRTSAKVEQVQAGRNVGMFRVVFGAPYAKYVHYRKYSRTASMKYRPEGKRRWKKIRGNVTGEIRHATGERLFLQHAMEYARHGMVSRVAEGAKVG
jgi:hypothetical protein